MFFQFLLYNLYSYYSNIAQIDLTNQKITIIYNIGETRMDNQSAYLGAVSSLQRLLAQVKYKKSTSMKSFIVALYTADDQNPLRFSGKIGMLQIDIDRPQQIYYLRFYDIQSLQLLLEVQFYYGLGQNYRKSQKKQNLYIFDLFADGIIGFQFRNAKQAQEMAIKIKSVSPKNEQFRQLMKARIQKEIAKKKQSSFFGKLKKNINGIFTKEQIHQQSVVLKVQKNKSIKMNFQTGEFDFDNVPPQWEDMLGKVGLKKEDLKDKQVARLIYQQTVLHQAKKYAQENPSQVNVQHLQMIKEQAKQSQKQDDAMTKYSVTDSQMNERNQNIGSSSQNLPPPPPPPPLFDLKPPPLSQGLSAPVQSSSNRSDLMAQIRNNKLKLKPVKATQKGVQLDISSMNKQQRHDLAEHIRQKLQRRKKALNRRKNSSQQQEENE